MESENRRPGVPCNSLVPQRWPQIRLLKDVRDLNEHVLEVLATISTRPPDATGSAEGYEDLWRSLDADSRWRAAQMPFLFLDLRFHDAEWWQHISSAVGEAGGDDCGSRREDTWQSQLATQALMLAWAAARADGLSASLLFGMARPVVEIVGGLPPKGVDHLCRIVCPAMRLRFSQTGTFWRRLVMAASQNDVRALREVHLYGLRLLGGEMLRGRSSIEQCGLRQMINGEGASRSRRVISSQLVSTD